jgi:glycosyltransferase involved in cell wall biosynthesis
MRFSIVMPVLNCESTIERAIASILAQDWPDLDFILMDGGSCDQTMEIAARYRSHFSHFISAKDGGQTHAINKGFALATGEALNWLCGDDEYRPGTFRRVADAFAANPGTNLVIGASCRRFSPTRMEVCSPSPDALARIELQNGIDQPACFWLAALHRRAGMLDESLRFGMDWDWWNKLKAAGASPVILPDVLADYHFHEESKTSSNPQGNLDEAYFIIKRHGPFGGALADIFMYLFEHYDLKGCYDQPATASQELMQKFWRELGVLTSIFGEKIIYSYNWNWISRQFRGLPWQ